MRTVALGSALRRNAAKTDALRESLGYGGQAAGDEVRRQTTGWIKGGAVEALSGRGSCRSAVSVAVKGMSRREVRLKIRAGGTLGVAWDSEQTEAVRRVALW